MEVAGLPVITGSKTSPMLMAACGRRQRDSDHAAQVMESFALRLKASKARPCRTRNSANTTSSIGMVRFPFSVGP